VTNQESGKLSRVINVRKLAAIDLYFLGPKIILTEFGLGVPIMLLRDMADCARHLSAAAGDQLHSNAVVRNRHRAKWFCGSRTWRRAARKRSGDAQVQGAVAVAASAVGGTGSVAEAAARRVTVIIGRNSARRHSAGRMF
jgi:hypothetical protein